MNRERVAKTWVYRGLTDLLFAFDNDDVAFEDQARFFEIMGLEKFLKAVLLYNRHAEYEQLSAEEGKVKLDKMAKEFNHNFDRMLNELADGGLHSIKQIKEMMFHSYKGSELVKALSGGYMETRYPRPVPVSDGFPYEPDAESGCTYMVEQGFTRDPLSSSGLTHFIYALCNACFYELSQTIGFKDVLNRFHDAFQHRDSLRRFNNYFWESRCVVAGVAYE